jgi:hypothetical protein
MTGVINAGYDMTIGDVQLYYYLNHILPKVSIIDYLVDSVNNGLFPSNQAFSWTYAQTLLQQVPAGWDWITDANKAWIAEPYLKFNLGDWINENTQYTIITSGDYLEPIDLFAEYNETK